MDSRHVEDRIDALEEGVEALAAGEIRRDELDAEGLEEGPVVPAGEIRGPHLEPRPEAACDDHVMPGEAVRSGHQDSCAILGGHGVLAFCSRIRLRVAPVGANDLGVSFPDVDPEDRALRSRRGFSIALITISWIVSRYCEMSSGRPTTIHWIVRCSMKPSTRFRTREPSSSGRKSPASTPSRKASTIGREASRTTAYAESGRSCGSP